MKWWIKFHVKFDTRDKWTEPIIISKFAIDRTNRELTCVGTINNFNFKTLILVNDVYWKLKYSLTMYFINMFLIYKYIIIWHWFVLSKNVIFTTKSFSYLMRKYLVADSYNSQVLPLREWQTAIDGDNGATTHVS